MNVNQKNIVISRRTYNDLWDISVFAKRLVERLRKDCEDENPSRWVELSAIASWIESTQKRAGEDWNADVNVENNTPSDKVVDNENQVAAGKRYVEKQNNQWEVWISHSLSNSQQFETARKLVNDKSGILQKLDWNWVNNIFKHTEDNRSFMLWRGSDYKTIQALRRLFEQYGFFVNISGAKD